MPRVQTLTFTKDYQTVADGLATLLKNVQITEKEENGHPVIEIEGDFSAFVLEDMDMWEQHLKFEIKDFAITDESDSESRVMLARGMPGYASVLFSPTIAYVYKRVAYKTVTTTLIERVNDEERTVLSRDVQESEEQFDWVDCTGEFGRKVRIDR